MSGLPAEARVSIDGRPFSSRFSPELQADLAAAAREMTLRQALLDWLARTPVDAPYQDVTLANHKNITIELATPLKPPVATYDWARWQGL